MPDELTIAVVGARYANKGPGSREMEILMAAPGDPVDLRAEPDNSADKNAIAVFSQQGIQMGYILADRTLLFRQAAEAGKPVWAILDENEQTLHTVAKRPMQYANGFYLYVPTGKKIILPVGYPFRRIDENESLIGGMEDYHALLKRKPHVTERSALSLAVMERHDEDSDVPCFSLGQWKRGMC